jgi:glycosyltransferase involved in cell wall biosynthesis
VTLEMRGAADIGAVLRLRRLLRRERADLVHTHSSVDAWLGGLAARSLGRPVVRSRHVTIPIRHASVYRLADRVITSGERAAALVTGAGVPRRKVVAISAGVDLDRFHPGVSGKRVRDELAADGPLVGLIANLRGSKGHRYFIDAAGDVLRQVPAARFLIVGDGVGFADIERQLRERHLERAIRMLGFRRDIPEVMAALDVLVLPSVKSEATSQVILQALAVGTPVVATSVGGSPELIRDGVTGRLVPPADAAALARAIVDVLRDPDGARAMTRQGQAEVSATQSLDAVMRRTTAVYAELLDR